MPKIGVAHIREQGVDLIIARLDDGFEHKSQADQSEAINELQMRAESAGLAGTVVPVWNYGGRMRFIAPKNYHPYFQSINFDFIIRNINKEIVW